MAEALITRRTAAGSSALRHGSVAARSSTSWAVVFPDIDSLQYGAFEIRLNFSTQSKEYEARIVFAKFIDFRGNLVYQIYQPSEGTSFFSSTDGFQSISRTDKSVTWISSSNEFRFPVGSAETLTDGTAELYPLHQE